MRLLDVLRVLEIVCGLWAAFAIIRWDLRHGELLTGSSQLAAVLAVILAVSMRMLEQRIPYQNEMIALAIAMLLFSIGRFYYMKGKRRDG